MSFTELLQKAVTVTRAINAGDNVAPNYIEIPITVLNMVHDQLSAGQVLKDGNNKILADYKFYADHSYLVHEGDFLAVDFEKFYVHRIHNPNGMNHHIEIYALRLENTVVVS